MQCNMGVLAPKRYLNLRWTDALAEMRTALHVVKRLKDEKEEHRSDAKRI